MLGNYTVYSFIAPILQTVGGFASADSVVFLFVFGASGIIGTTIATKYAARHVSSSLVVPLGVLATSLALVVPACSSYVSVAVLFVVWGAAVTALMIGFQTVLLSVASDAADVATSLYSGIFNVGIGGGAFLGSLISEHAGFVPLSFAGAALVAAATLFCLVVWFKTGSAGLPSNKGA